VSSQVLVALLVTVVLGDVVQIISADDDGTGHLGGDDFASEYTTANRDLSGEGALLVNVGAVDSFGRGLKAQTDIFVPSLVFGTDFAITANLGIVEDGLLLERLLDLFGHRNGEEMAVLVLQASGRGKRGRTVLE